MSTRKLHLSSAERRCLGRFGWGDGSTSTLNSVSLSMGASGQVAQVAYTNRAAKPEDSDFFKKILFPVQWPQTPISTSSTASRTPLSPLFLIFALNAYVKIYANLAAEVERKFYLMWEDKTLLRLSRMLDTVMRHERFSTVYLLGV